MHAAKHAIRTLLKDLTHANPSNKQWAALETNDDDARDAGADGGAGAIDVEAVGCSICGLLDSTEEDDILLCDRAGCVTPL